MNLMMNEKEYSILIGDNSNNNCLNETFFSHMTRGSGEKEYKELASLITKAVDDKDNNVSNSSISKILNISNSILSNIDWNGNSSRDDSRQFIDNFNVIKNNTQNQVCGRGKSQSLKQRSLLYINTSFKPKAKENTLIKNYKTKNFNYNYNEEDIEENNSKESNEDWNASKIPKTDFNQNNLIELTNRKTNSKYFSKSQQDENENNLISFTDGNYLQAEDKIENLIDLKEFNSNDSSFARTFSPKNSNSYKIDDAINFNQGPVFNGVSSKFPRMPKKYSDIASIIKKDIHEAIKKEKEKDTEDDSPRKFSSLSNNNVNNNTTANTNVTNNTHTNSNNSNLIILPEQKTEEVKEKKPQKLNLFDILSGTNNKDDSANNKKTKNNPKNMNNKEFDKIEILIQSSNSNSNKLINSSTQNSTLKPYKLGELNSIKPNKNNLSSGGSNTISNNNSSKSSYSYNYYSMYNHSNSNNNYDFNYSQTPNGKNKSNSNYSVSNFNSNENTNRKYNYIDAKSHAKEEYQDFKVNLINIISGKDKRTTIMLRNIPNKYTLQNLVDEINSLFIGKYDYINLPIDFERKLNLGYGFINFIDPLYIVSFYEHYVSKKWHKYKSDKKIDINYAEKQGKKDATNKDENTYFAPNKKTAPKIELPIKYLDLFKKVYPNSVCVTETKPINTTEKTFHVKSLGNPTK